MFVSIFFLFALFGIMARWKNDLSLVDIAWGLAPISYWISLTLHYQTFTLENFLIGGLLFLWGMRLALFLTYRNKKLGEDRRYLKVTQSFAHLPRTSWAFWLKAWTRIYFLQAVLSWIVCSPLQIIASSSLEIFASSTFIDSPISNHPRQMLFLFIQTMAIIQMTIGLLYESISDWQKWNFKKSSSNHQPETSPFCEKGLWKYSWHPNYFGELLFWYGMSLFAITYVFLLNPPTLFTQLSLLFQSLIGPLFLNFLIYKISGVPFLHQYYRNSPDYKNAYEERKKTLKNLFFPKF